MAILINHHCNATVIRITTADFIDAINECKCFLHHSPLDGSWKIPVFAHKRSSPPWVDQVLQCGVDPAAGFAQITCITQIPLDIWQSMAAAEIRLRIPGAPGAKKRFLAAVKRFSKFKDALSTFVRLHSLDVTPRSHVVAPTWDGNEACFHCAKLIQFSVEPRNLTRNCPPPWCVA